jgi:hypothetical protein
MSISNELTSELTTALLDSFKNQNPVDSRELAEIVLNFHATLRPLEREAVRRRVRPAGFDGQSGPSAPSRDL